MSRASFREKLRAMDSETEMYLEEIDEIENYPEEVQSYMIDCYGYGKCNEAKILGTLLKSVFKQRRYVFMYTRKNLIDILAKDNDIHLNTISGNGLGKFRRFLFKQKIVKCHRDPIPGKAGVYELIDPDLTGFMAKICSIDIKEAQMEKALHFYDNCDIIKNKRKGKIEDENIPSFSELKKGKGI